ncbi:MAG: hypothetical protein GX829_10925 [Clostridium sp.]|nr:hypothetical protein [Clostridium sp.]
MKKKSESSRFSGFNKNNLKAHFTLMVSTRAFKVSFTMVFIMAMLSYLYNLYEVRNTDINQMKSAYTFFILNESSRLLKYFEVLLPIIVVFPFVFSYLDDKDLKAFPYLLSRQTKRSYFTSKYIISIFGGFLIIFLPLMINLILSTFTFPLNNNTHWGGYNYLSYEEIILGTSRAINTRFSGLPYLKVFLFSPTLYNILFVLIASIFASALTSFAFAFSMFLQKYKILLLLPTSLLVRLLSFLDVYVYSLAYRGIPYINLNFISYIEVSGYTLGKTYLLFFGFIVILFFIGYGSMEYAIRRKSDDFV